MSDSAHPSARPGASFVTDFIARRETYCARLDTALDAALPQDSQYPARLHAAMRYACTGGKRLRALLVYAAGETLQLPADALDAPAAAVELIHAYSLVHDDLPAMDDDDLRRGRPTVHKAYDEATAILVGDALQTLAFQVLATPGAPLTAAQRLTMCRLLAEASGSRGMAGGQAIDLESEGRNLPLAELEALHIHKTGALIRACLRMACAAHPAPPADCVDALDRYGKCVGLAFQIQDDILDVEGNAAVLGKRAGKDTVLGKSTYPTVMGLPAARERAADLFAQALAALEPFGEQAAPLQALTVWIRQRSA